MAPPQSAEPEHSRYVALMQKTLTAALASLVPKDRLRVACYYAKQLTLAQTGRPILLTCWPMRRRSAGDARNWTAIVPLERGGCEHSY